MKRKSIGGFVTGLVGIVAGLPIGFYSYLIIGLILAFSENPILAYSVYLFFAAAVLAIVGVCFYFTKARVGGILMLIATLLYLAPFICCLYATLAIGGSILELMFAILIGNIPTLLLFISAMLGLLSRARPTIITNV